MREYLHWQNVPKLVPFTYQEALTLNFICDAYDFAALSVFVYVQFNNMGKIEVPIGITKLQKEILNLQLERQNIPSELQYECSTPEHRNNGKTLANLVDELFKFHHENHNLRVQVMTRIQQLKKSNEEIQNLPQAL